MLNEKSKSQDKVHGLIPILRFQKYVELCNILYFIYMYIYDRIIFKVNVQVTSGRGKEKGIEVIPIGRYEILAIY